LILGLARELKNSGSSISTYLTALSERYGFVQTGQISIRVQDLSIIKKIMQGLRDSTPNKLGHWEVDYEDLKLGLKLPSTDGVVLKNSEIRVIIRPSGTEPKLKCYLLARGDSADAAEKNLVKLKEVANSLLSALQ
jgi:phosphomannomutase